MSRRLAGLNPEYGLLNSTSTPTLARVPKRRGYPTSEPIPVAEKVPRLQSSVLTEDQAVPLSKDEMLAILSKEMPLDKASIVENFMTRSNIVNQNVPSIYSSYFFRKDIIKEFQRNIINTISTEKLITFPLSTYNLYNKDDILNNTTYRPDIVGSRNIEKTSGYTEESTNNMSKFITLLSTKICSQIGDRYARESVEQAIDLVKNEEKFDILVASTRVIEDITLTLEQRLQGVVAFIIVELNECHTYSAAYSIKLICVKANTSTTRVVSGTGSVLMAAFLYTILSHPNNDNPSVPIVFPPGESFLNVTSKTLTDGTKIENCTFGSFEQLIPVQQIAVLELAGAYKNTGGLCMYEKFGFMYEQTMFSDTTKGIDCFTDRGNLPMLIDFDTKQGYVELDKNGQKQKIVDIVVGKDRGFQKSIICGVQPAKKQELLGIVKTIKLFIDNTPGVTLANFPYTNLTERSIVGEILNMHKNYRRTRTSVPANTVIKDGTLEEVIDYLENPTNDPVMEPKINVLLAILPNKRGGSLRKTKKNNRH
jgi:hypothetical protein